MITNINAKPNNWNKPLYIAKRLEIVTDDEDNLVINTEKLPDLTNLVKEELPEDVVIKADNVFSEEFLKDLREFCPNAKIF